MYGRNYERYGMQTYELYRSGDPLGRRLATNGNWAGYRQRCGREVRVNKVDINYSSERTSGELEGTMEMSNGGIADVRWTLCGWCKRVVMRHDLTNGVDHAYAQEQWEAMKRGDFDLVVSKTVDDVINDIAESEADVAEKLRDCMKQCFGQPPTVPTREETKKAVYDALSAHFARKRQSAGDDSCDCGGKKHGWGHSHWCKAAR